MGQTVSSEILHALTTCLSAAFTRGLSGVEPQWKRIASEVAEFVCFQHLRLDERFAGHQRMGWRASAGNAGGYGYTITNKLWESSLRVKREHIEDDQIGQYSITAERYGRMTAVFPDKLCYGLLCAGFNTLCFDGQNFFDEDHPLGDGTYSNVVGTPASDLGEPWFLIDESQVLKPIIWQPRRAFKLKPWTI